MKNTIKKIIAIATLVMVFASIMAVSAFAEQIEYIDIYDDYVISGGYIYIPTETIEYIDVYDNNVIIPANYYNPYYNPYVYNYNPYAYQYTVPRTYNAVVVKNPGGETVKAGGTALFIVGATNVQSMTWKLVSADGQTVIDLPQGVYDKDMKDVSPEAAAIFNSLKLRSLIDGNGYYELQLSNIEAETNGWSVMAEFVGLDNGVVSTTNATVTVI